PRPSPPPLEPYVASAEEEETANAAHRKAAAGDHRGALADLDLALAAHPGWARCWLEKGEIALQLKEPGPSIASFDRALALAPSLSRALMLRGVARDETGDGEGGLADLDAAIASAPSADAYFKRSRVRRTLKDLEGA